MPYTPNNPYIPGDPYSYDLKWIVEEVKTAISLYEPLSDDFTQLYNYVHDYFDNLDVTAEVRAIIMQMEAAGYFENLVQQIINDDQAVENAVSAWLDANVDPVGSAVLVDTTLTISGAAADSQITGDRISAAAETATALATKGGYIEYPQMTQGSINPATGAETITDARTWRTGFIQVSDILELDADLTYTIYAYYYDSDQTYIAPRVLVNSAFVLDSSKYYVRFIVNYSSAITEDQASTALKFTLKSVLYDLLQQKWTVPRNNLNSISVGSDEKAQSICLYGKTVQTGTGKASMNNVRTISGISTLNFDIDGTSYSITLDDPIYEGDYVDIVNKKIVRNMGYYVINSDSTITQEALPDNHYRFRIPTSIPWDNSKGWGVSDKLYSSNSPIIGGTTDETVCCFTGTNRIYAVIDQFATVTDLYNWLASNTIQFLGYRAAPLVEDLTASIDIPDDAFAVNYTGIIKSDIETDKETYLKYYNEGVTVGAGGDYAHLLDALKLSDADITVKSGTYDLISEYTNYYGADFWTNYDYTQGIFDRFLYGLWVSDRKITFSADSIISCHYTGANTEPESYFSAFATGSGVVLDGLNVDYDNIRYAIHDDYSTAGAGTITEFKNCVFNGTPNYSAVIGGGCGIRNTYLIHNCYFNIGGLINKNCISYHNNKGAVALNKIIVSNCYGNGSCSFEWYGTSQDVTPCIVNNSKFTYISCAAHYQPPNTDVNMKLIDFNNTLI